MVSEQRAKIYRINRIPAYAGVFVFGLFMGNLTSRLPDNLKSAATKELRLAEDFRFINP